MDEKQNQGNLACLTDNFSKLKYKYLLKRKCNIEILEPEGKFDWCLDCKKFIPLVWVVSESEHFRETFHTKHWGRWYLGENW